MKKLCEVLPLVLVLASAGSAFAAVPKAINLGTVPTYAPF